MNKINGEKLATLRELAEAGECTAEDVRALGLKFCESCPPANPLELSEIALGSGVLYRVADNYWQFLVEERAK